MEITKAAFLTSVASLADIPGDLPEIAVSGKSNVGKSSFINCLCRRNALARVSATPGKTRLLNYFSLNDSFYLVDLPGYGYAKVSAADQAKWNRLTENYLMNSPNLVHVIQLLDIRHAPTADDKQMIAWLLHRGCDFTLVTTKCDKLSKSQWNIRTSAILKDLGLPSYFPVIPWSSEKGTGMERMLDTLESALDDSLKREEV